MVLLRIFLEKVMVSEISTLLRLMKLRVAALYEANNPFGEKFVNRVYKSKDINVVLHYEIVGKRLLTHSHRYTYDA